MDVRQNESESESLVALIEHGYEGYDYQQPWRREVRQAEIVEISEEDILVDLGAKRDGVVPRNDLRYVDGDYLAALQLGDRVPVVVLHGPGTEDDILVSLSRGL